VTKRYAIVKMFQNYLDAMYLCERGHASSYYPGLFLPNAVAPKDFHSMYDALNGLRVESKSTIEN
jgi:hypothetical protein